MTRIWKVQLNSEPEQVINLPAKHKILSVQTQNDRICIWYMFAGNLPIPFEVMIVPTGIRFKKRDFKYIGTAQLLNFVAHVFIRPQK